MSGLVISALGILFGLVILNQLKNLPVHRSMREISELIYETCKTYLVTQGRFLAILEIFIAVIIVLYFGVLEGDGVLARPHHPGLQRRRHSRQLQRRVVRHPREHLCELAHRLRQPRRQAVPGVCDSAQGRHEHWHAAHQRRAADHALHPAVHSGRLRRRVLHRLRHR
jgi:hypothetical protein